MKAFWAEQGLANTTKGTSRSLEQHTTRNRVSCGSQTESSQTPEQDVGEVGLPVTLGTRAAGQSSLPKTAGGRGVALCQRPQAEGYRAEFPE